MRWGSPNPLPAPWPQEHGPDVARSTRLLIADVTTAALTETMPAGQEVVAGAPTAHHRGLLDDRHGSVGIWEMSEGSVRDVEVDEVFLVVGGQAVLEIDGEPAIGLRPGTLVQLRAGDRTTWTVTESLRKVYLQFP